MFYIDSWLWWYLVVFAWLHTFAETHKLYILKSGSFIVCRLQNKPIKGRNKERNCIPNEGNSFYNSGFQNHSASVKIGKPPAQIGSCLHNSSSLYPLQSHSSHSQTGCSPPASLSINTHPNWSRETYFSESSCTGVWTIWFLAPDSIAH